MELDQILRFAVKHGISDVHLKVNRPPLFRKDGSLVSQQRTPPVTAEMMERWFRQIASERVQAEYAERHEADLSLSLSGAGRFRINAFSQRSQLAMVFRHIPPRVKSVAELGLPLVLESVAEQRRGLILATGATGSGKSTTLAAMIESINQARACHIVTIEDPIEFVFEERQAVVNQREVGADTLSFPAALRAAMRQDPDVILIGELRDLETVETAIQAAETGHLVLSTLHTVDAMETVSRLVGMFPPFQQDQVRLQLSTILRAVVSQRLVRRHGGGRVAACEIMIRTEFIRELIADPNRTHELPEAIRQGKVTYGSQTFDQALLELFNDRQVTRDEALTNATNPADLKLQMEGIM